MTENLLAVKIVIKMNINECTLLHFTWKYFQTRETMDFRLVRCTAHSENNIELRKEFFLYNEIKGKLEQTNQRRLPV